MPSRHEACTKRQTVEPWRISQALDNVKTLAIDAQQTSTLYSGSPAGLFKTTDAGMTWTLLMNVDTRDIRIDPRSSFTVYAATSKGISKSVDGGPTGAICCRDRR